MTRVLMIEDHAIVRRGLKEIFMEQFPELEVGEANDSDTALKELAREKWDVVLLDINLPGRSGLELLEDIKRRSPQTPVLILSAYPEEEFAVRSLKLGASGYLSKKLAPEELVAATRKALAGRRYVTVSLAERLAASLGGDFAGAPHESLSGRELEVLRRVARGQTIKEVAADLKLSEKTVGTYRTRISRKLHLSTNVELARYAIQHHLVD